MASKRVLVTKPPKGSPRNGPVRPSDPTLGKKAAGQPSRPAPRDSISRANFPGKPAMSTDKLKCSSAEKLKSYADSRSYLFDKMFSSPAAAPLRTQNRISPKTSPVDAASPLPLSPDFVPSSPSPQNGVDGGGGGGDGGDGGGSESGTYTIEKETEAYESARRTDLSQPFEEEEAAAAERGRADGDDKSEEEGGEGEEEKEEEEEEEEELPEPLSASEAQADWDSDEVEQEVSGAGLEQEEGGS